MKKLIIIIAITFISMITFAQNQNKIPEFKISKYDSLKKIEMAPIWKEEAKKWKVQKSKYYKVPLPPGVSQKEYDLRDSIRKDEIFYNINVNGWMISSLALVDIGYINIIIINETESDVSVYVDCGETYINGYLVTWGKKKLFNNRIDVFNFMYRNGYKYVEIIDNEYDSKNINMYLFRI